MWLLKWVGSFVVIVVSCAAICIYGGVSGWWLKAIAPQGDTPAFFYGIKEKISAENRGNIALVLLEKGEVVAEDYALSVDSVGPNTLFPIASMSKFISAYGVMKLVETEKLQLDQPVASYLSRWQLPESEFDLSGVTLKRLLSHTAGLTDGLGFGDYEADEQIPSLENSLSNPRSSSEPRVIQVGLEPGGQWEYSGGGHLLTELIIEEVAGKPFAEYIQEAVFDPIGMTRSTYVFLEEQSNISPSYDVDGQPAPLYRYASNAATGLSSTAADLTMFTQSLLAENKAISEAMQEPLGFEMGAAIWGVGAILYAPTSKGRYVFGHDGANDPAINSALRINPNTGDAIIVLTTGGNNLASSVAYEWTLWQTGYPDFFSLDKAFASAFIPLGIGIIVATIGFFLAFFMLRKKRKQ